MKRFIWGTLFMSVSSLGFAADWVEIDSNDFGQIFVDNESIQKNGHNIKVWEKLIPTTPTEVDENTSIEKIVNFIEMSCPEAKYRELQSMAYITTGENYTDNEISDWKYLAPDTSGYAEYEYLCK